MTGSRPGRRTHDDPRAGQRPHASCASTGIRRHEPRRGTGTEITFEADAVYEIGGQAALGARHLHERDGLKRAPRLDSRSETSTEMTCDAEPFFVSSTLRVLDGGEETFTRTWSFAIPRSGG